MLSLGLSTIPALAAKERLNTKTEGLKSDPDGIIDLPAGFTYSVLSREKELMDDGLLVPPNADGMACIKLSKNKVILIRNHEIGHVPRLSPFVKRHPYGNFFRNFFKTNSDKFYDIKKNKTHCFGGTTSIVYDTKHEKVESQYLSLAGTLVNCSGGVTPWGTWITCEETTLANGRGLTKNHGYNFEVVPSISPKLNKARPLKGMGRFRHEGVAFDPNSGYVYQTEDRSNGLLYRFNPNVKNKLLSGGKLETLSFRDWRGIDTSNQKKNNIILGRKYPVKWIELKNVSSNKDNLRERGQAMGGATFSRGEGIFYSNEILYFTATTGGKNRTGQIWKYTPNKNDSNGIIELFYESKDANVLNMPDNIVISPHGNIILCEDAKGRDRLVCIKSDGSVSYLASNAFNNAEFAGLTFSPDGNILFVNIYSPTMTLAIKGPWEEL